MKTSIRGAVYGLGMLCAGVWAGEAVAATAYGPICDTAAKVQCPSGTLGGILDVSNGTCATHNYRAMLLGSHFYSYYGGCAGACSGSSTCNGGAGNYYVVTGGSGWDFRMLHVYPNASAGSKTCDRCAVGLVGGTGNTTFSHAHAENRQYGTRSTAWLSGSVSCGASGYCGNVMGYPTL